jgi:hypothetical protein
VQLNPLKIDAKIFAQPLDIPAPASLYVVVTQRISNPTENGMNQTTTTSFFDGWHFDPDTGRWWRNKD